jgi:hypothetical protein
MAPRTERPALLPALDAVLLAKALALLGSSANLAARLKVDEYLVLMWLAGYSSIPRRILRVVIDLIVQAERARRPAARAPRRIRGSRAR